MTLRTDFLLARFAEEEDLWRLAVDADLAFVAGRGSVPAVPPEGFARKMLAECEAKRRVVTDLEALFEDGMCDQWEIEKALDIVYPLLAAPYASHPDYRQEDWKR